MSLPDKWKKILHKLSFSYQPIVATRTGETIAVEALIRGTRQLGFRTIDDFFNSAFLENVMFELEIELRNMAITNFTQIPFHKKI